MKSTKEKAAKPKSLSKAPVAHGVGRRKSSVARIWLRPGKGVITVNSRPYKEYFDTEVAQKAAQTAFAVTGINSYDVDVNVQGGGLHGQADAVKLGIARALIEVQSDLRPTLKEHGLLQVDSRLKERKKYGQRGARRKFQFVKR